MWGGVVDLTKAPFYSHPCLVLYLFLTRSRTPTLPVCPIHRLPCSVNLICPAMLPPTFPSLLISFLSIQYSPLSHFLSRSCSISPSPQWAVSLSRSAEQRAWVRLQTSLQWIDKNRALVAAAGEKGKAREEMKIRESKKGKRRLK